MKKNKKKSYKWTKTTHIDGHVIWLLLDKGKWTRGIIVRVYKTPDCYEWFADNSLKMDRAGTGVSGKLKYAKKACEEICEAYLGD